MNKVVQGALSVAVAMAALYGVKSLRQHTAEREPTAEEVSKQMDDLQARATREHVDMAATDAQKEVASQEAAKKLATQTGGQHANTAADMFWGSTSQTQRARYYCTQRGVDLAPFTTALAKEHRAELERATKLIQMPPHVKQALMDN